MSRHFVFDAVGTLIRPRESISATYRQFGRPFGIDLATETVKQRFRDARRVLFGNDPENVSSEQIERQKWYSLVGTVFRELDDPAPLFEALWQYYSVASSWQLFSDVPQTVRELQLAGHSISIASNFDRRLIEICRDLPPLDQVDRIFCSSIVGYLKPDVRFYKSIHRTLLDDTLAYSADPPIMIGDDPVKDVETPRAAGWQAHLIDRSQCDLNQLVHRVLAEQGS